MALSGGDRTRLFRLCFSFSWLLAFPIEIIISMELIKINDVLFSPFFHTYIGRTLSD